MQHFLVTYGYAAIFLLTVLESACIPIPSEVTLGLAGALCSSAFASSSGDSPLNLLAVIVVAILGSVLGSFIAYVVGRTAGRSVVDKWGKYLLLTHGDLDRAESWFEKKGEAAVLFGRVVPVVRTFISFPAGVAEMKPVRFGIFSTIGISVWVVFLTVMGYNLGGQYDKWTKGISWAGYAVAALVVIVLMVALYHRYQQVKKEHGGHGKPAA